MTATKHPRGFRPVVVHGVRFRWRFRAGERDSELTVVGPGRSGCRLVVLLRGWQDPWLAISGFTLMSAGLQLHSDATGNEPAVVGPAFARAAIESAVGMGWDYHSRTAAFELEYEDGRFSCTG